MRLPSAWPSLWLLAASAVGIQAAVKADPDMKSIPVCCYLPYHYDEY